MLSRPKESRTISLAAEQRHAMSARGVSAPSTDHAGPPQIYKWSLNCRVFVAQTPLHIFNHFISITSHESIMYERILKRPRTETRHPTQHDVVFKLFELIKKLTEISLCLTQKLLTLTSAVNNLRTELVEVNLQLLEIKHRVTDNPCSCLQHEWAGEFF
ncbi:hypothetical protein L1987_20235 [Smallanthus sonchifolius]|uniref:Uncharacterized protein n=1 Tax=Smallanthus sonchifolius TaxID=185202 RepID=A0ACB9IRG5_9ASTR|nr:hypothetical protein L1987_20235 [Smallanthus sonchifolius]